MAYPPVADDIDKRGLPGPQCTFERWAELLGPLDDHRRLQSFLRPFYASKQYIRKRSVGDTNNSLIFPNPAS